MSKDFDEQYKTLNPKQKEAVDAIEGPVMVVAGPGTGKTTILTLRIANILKQTDASPESILALTFTNTGVHRMREKLVEYIGDEAYRVNIFTFHAFAENILKEFNFYFPEFEYSKPISDLDKVKIIEEIIDRGDFKELVSDYDRYSSMRNIIKSIDEIKKEGLDPEDFAKILPEWEKLLYQSEDLYYKRKFKEFNVGDIRPPEEEKLKNKLARVNEVQNIFAIYQDKIRELGFYDFNDTILSVINQLEKNENLKAELQERYQYILVDEHQDTNDGQNRIVELLTDAEHLNGHPNLFTVGDEKQSIYRFQGASDKAFKHFNQIYNDVKVIDLKDNYRSTSDILNSAHSLIKHSLEDAKELEAHKDNGQKIKVREFSSYKFELLAVAEDIKKSVEQGVSPEEIAVIYRSNKDVEDIKNILSHYKIPYTINSKENLLDDRDIENMISILRVIDNLNDDYSLGQILLIDFLHLDSYWVVSKLQEFHRISRKEKINLFDFLSKFDESKDLVEKMKSLKILEANHNFDSFFKKFLEEIGYLDFVLSKDDSQYRLMKLDKLFDEIKRQVYQKKNYRTSDFIKFIDAYKKYNLDIEAGAPEILGGVRLMTAHKSKGLEFERVYIINAVRSSWEKSRGFAKIALPIDSYKGTEDDERRLFYVSMTRAKEYLSISFSNLDWQGREQDKSQFIAEMDQDLLDYEDEKVFEKENINKLELFMRDIKELKSIWDKEYLGDLFLNSNLSVTALNNYLRCPIEYLFRSLIKLPSEYSVSLMYGNLIHGALEKYFKESKREENLLPKEKLIGFFEDLMDMSMIPNLDFNRYLKRGKDNLGGYFERYFKDWSLNIDLEKHIKRDFDLGNNQKITLSGILDKVEYLDNSIEGRIKIVDYKTGKTFSEKDKIKKNDLERQIIFYNILLEGYHDGAYIVDSAVLDFVEKNKKGEYEKYEVKASKEKIDLLKDEINKMSQEIISGEFLDKGCRKKDCEYCRFKK